jgi:predicted ATPase/DNA-binding SARP family transcriptional activator
VRILGPVDLQRPGLPATGLSPQLRVVLALLAGHHRSVVSVDRLCDALWGDDQSDAAVATLQSHLSRVRRLVGPEGEIVAIGGGYRLDITDGEVDADRFEHLVGLARKAGPCAEAADLYRSALACWRGPAFGELADAVWMRALAVRLDELHLTVTEEWIECRLAIGGDGSLTGDLEGLVASHPLRERFLRQLMVVLYRDSRRAEALRRAHQFRTLLRDDMGLDPSPAMLAVEAQVLADDPVLVGSPAVSMPSMWRAIVDDPTRLVGRDDVLARIGEAVATMPLVTLVGPGGVGKTRLARRVAAVAQGYDDGVVFVELAAVNDPDSLLDAMATALDVQQRHRLSVEESLLAALAERQQLVVFDNCEHLLDKLVPCVDNLRTRCPRLRVLATSREPLGLPGEVVVVVPPLSVDTVGLDDPEAVAESPAVELLIERVAATVPGFTITTANAAALGDICRRLDGLPLALELVAARFRSLDPATVLQRLDEPTVVLDTSMRSADPRHRTLRDTIAWSYAHLNSAEQMLFARLSTFAGSFDVESVEAVCGRPQGEGTAGAYIVDVLAALVDKSMVQLVDRDNARYQLLETLREYAREKLSGFGSADVIDAAHLRWFTEVAEQASVGLTGPDEAAWSQRIERDFDNYRVAHLRAVRTDDVDAALRLVAGLREFAFRRIRYELITWAATCLTMPAAATHPKCPVAEAIVAYGHYVRGDLEPSIAAAMEAIAHEQDGLDSSGLAERTLGNAFGYLGRYDEALQWMDRMLTSARRGSPSRLAHALYMRSVGETSVGRTVQGAIFAGEARAMARESGSPTAQAQASYALGLALEGSEPLESLRLLRESSRLAGAAGNRWIEAFAQTEVWWLEARNGDVRTALTGSGRVIDTWHRGGDWANLLLSLRRVFGLLVQIGDHYGAAVLHGALVASGATSALPFEPSNANDLDVDVALLIDSLGQNNYGAAVETGAGLPQSALVTFVQERIVAQTLMATPC